MSRGVIAEGILPGGIKFLGEVKFLWGIIQGVIDRGILAGGILARGI
jgi:hypothetical protein